MVAGLWGNSNLDDGKSTRQQALQEIETSYLNVLISIYDDTPAEEDILKIHPFFKAMDLD